MVPQHHLTQLRQKMGTHLNAEELKTLCFELEHVDYDNLPSAGKANQIRDLLQLLNQQGRIAELRRRLQALHPDTVWVYQARLFIAYARRAAADSQLAHFLHDHLAAAKQIPFIDQTIRSGADWLVEIDREIQTADFLIVLLSPTSADSEMMQSEIKRAYDYRQQQGKPHILPVRLAYEGLLPYAIDAFLSRTQYILWNGTADNEQVASEIMAAINGRFLPKSPIQPPPFTPTTVLSEDGRFLSTSAIHPQPPLPEFDPRLLTTLAEPGGAVKLRDTLYVQRAADQQLQQQLLRWGSTTTIRAPRQTGKTSLLLRGLHQTKAATQSVFFDFQTMGSQKLADQETFLRELAETICHELHLDKDLVAEAWQGNLGGQNKLTYFLEDHVLPTLEKPLVLAIDEADALLKTDYYRDFFGLLRSWHNRRPLNELWDRLNLVLVISTEPYLLINDIHQSPFNVGLQLSLDDFTAQQVQWLNQQHDSPIPTAHLPRFMPLLNGHPYLTRKLLYLLATRQPVTGDNMVADDGPFGDHLRRLYWGVRGEGRLLQGLREVLANGRCRDEDTRWRLLRAGLIQGSGNAYAFRCGLYKLYFQRKLRS